MKTKTIINSFMALALCSVFFALPSMAQDASSVITEDQATLEESSQENIDEKDEKGLTALMRASMHGDKVKVDELIAKKANLNIKSDDGYTALMYAVKSGYTDIVETLAPAEGINLNIKSDDGDTALIMAINRADEDMVTILADKGANLDAKNNQGETPLLIAFNNRDTKIFGILVDKGANVNIKYENGNTLLIKAVYEEYMDALYILSAKANLDMRNDDGQTALSVAFWSRQNTAVYQLIVSGANLSIRYNSIIEEKDLWDETNTIAGWAEYYHMGSMQSVINEAVRFKQEKKQEKKLAEKREKRAERRARRDEKAHKLYEKILSSAPNIGPIMEGFIETMQHEK